jgi:hypothetical protein
MDWLNCHRISTGFEKKKRAFVQLVNSVPIPAPIPIASLFRPESTTGGISFESRGLALVKYRISTNRQIREGNSTNF